MMFSTILNDDNECNKNQMSNVKGQCINRIKPRLKLLFFPNIKGCSSISFKFQQQQQNYIFIHFDQNLNKSAAKMKQEQFSIIYRTCKEEIDEIVNETLIMKKSLKEINMRVIEQREKWKNVNSLLALKIEATKRANENNRIKMMSKVMEQNKITCANLAQQLKKQKKV